MGNCNIERGRERGRERERERERERLARRTPWPPNLWALGLPMGEDTSVGEGAAGVREEGARGGVRRIRGGGKQTVGGEKGDATMEEEDTGWVRASPPTREEASGAGDGRGERRASYGAE